MKILILDDSLARLVKFMEKYGTDNTVITVMTALECIEQLKLQTFDLVCLDHDLGGKQMVSSGKGTGYEVAEWMAGNNEELKAPPVVIHSFNVPGANNMNNVLRKAHIQTIIAPGYWAQQ